MLARKGGLTFKEFDLNSEESTEEAQEEEDEDEPCPIEVALHPLNACPKLILYSSNAATDNIGDNRCRRCKESHKSSRAGRFN